MSTSSDLDFGGRITLEDGFSRVADRVSTRFNQLRSSFGNNIRGMGRSIVGLTGSLLGIGHLLSPMGLAFGIGMLGRAAIRSSSEMENLRIAFTTMLGSGEAANEHLQMLQRFAVGKPFEFRDLVVASRNLQTFGFQAVEVRGLLQDFGDAAFNAGTGLRGVNAQVNVFGTILATNKVTFGQLRQLVRAGVPAFQILRDQLHLTDQQLRNIARSGIQGRVIIEALRAGMRARFAGGMDRAAQTISARISDLNDVAGIFLSQVGDELRPTILGFLNELGRGITNTDFALWARRTADALATMARVGRIVLAPILGAFDDLGARWSRDQGRAVRPLRLFIANFRDVIRGVEALLSSEGTNGIGRIPASLQRILIDRGLWPITVRIARWGDRVRAIVGGFIEGVVSELKAMGAIVQWIGNRFGLFSGGLSLTHDQAVRLGRALVIVLAVMSTLRTLTIIYTTVTTAASVAINTYRLAVIATRIAQQQFGLAQMRTALGAMRLQQAFAAMGGTGMLQMRTALMLMRVQALIPTITGMAQMRVALGLMRVQSMAAAASIRLMTGAQWLLNAALNANPIGLVVLGIALVAAETYILIRYWDQITGFLQRWSPLLKVLAVLFAPFTMLLATFLALPVAIAYVYKHWDQLGASLKTGGGAVLSIVTRVAHGVRLVGDAILVVGYLATLWLGQKLAPLFAIFGRVRAAVGSALASAFDAFTNAMRTAATVVGGFVRTVVGGLVDAVMFTGRLLYALFGGIAGAIRDGLVALFPFLGGYFARVNLFLASVGTAVRSVFEGLGGAVSTFFGGLFGGIVQRFRTMAGELVTMFRALPARLQPAGLSDSIARLDAFSRGGAEPGAAGAGNGATPAPVPGGPTVPQLIVQRTAAQARVGAAGANAPAPAAPINVQPSNVVVQLDGRVLATAMQRVNEDENLRRGGRGSED